MSAERLQAAIRRTKTPVALVLDPREDRLEKKYLKNFTDLYGDCPKMCIRDRLLSLSSTL